MVRNFGPNIDSIRHATWSAILPIYEKLEKFESLFDE